VANCIAVNRRTDIVPLRQVTAPYRQFFQDLRLRDPLGNHRHAQIVTQADSSTNNDLVILVFQHSHHKGLINLDLRNRQATQVGQRGVAGAKIVDRDPHPDAGEVAEQL
jgi:hypothetical protein